MTRSTLRQTLARLEEPVDVDVLGATVDAARRAVERARDALRGRIPEAVAALAEASADARQRSADVARIDEQTRGGLLATLLSTTDDDAVERKRADAARSLAGSIAVVERRIEDARALATQVPELAADGRYGRDVFERLAARAEGGGLGAPEIERIRAAARVCDAVPDALRGVTSPLSAPIQEAEAAVRGASAVLAELRGTARAATVGESLLDGFVSPDSGAIGQAVRRKIAGAAPGLVPDLDRDAADRATAMAEIESERDTARDRARRDADARAAAMAELDELDGG